jgi:hypothetical protein
MTKEKDRTEKLAILQEKYGRKELSFGCEVNLLNSVNWEDEETPMNEIYTIGKTGENLYFQEEIKNDTGKIYKNCCATFAGGEDRTFWIHTKYKILGHPLTLSDVMMAMGEKDRTLQTTGIIEESSLYVVYSLPDNRFTWDLSKNLLRDQSDETIDAIFEILNPKEND